jgi:hypothetical protein
MRMNIILAVVFAQKLELTLGGKPVPKTWLDQFFMRNFTGYSAFDETLPIDDGLLETGLCVSPEEVKEQFEKWLRGRKMVPEDTELLIQPRMNANERE